MNQSIAYGKVNGITSHLSNKSATDHDGIEMKLSVAYGKVKTTTSHQLPSQLATDAPHQSPSAKAGDETVVGDSPHDYEVPYGYNK